MNKEYTNLLQNAQQTSVESTQKMPTMSIKPNPSHNNEQKTQHPRRGRPATGKRSNPDWVGRTYYIKRKTDLDIEGELFRLKRQGIEMDKSELVNNLLSAWATCRKTGGTNVLLGDILKFRSTP